MEEISNQNNQNGNQIDARELVKIFNTRFDKMEQSNQEMAKKYDARFDRMEQNYQEMKKDSDARFDKIEQNYQEMKKDSDARFDKIEQNYQEMKKDSDARFDRMEENHQEMAKKIDRMEQFNCELLEFLGEQFDKMNAKIDTKADKVDMEKILAAKADKSDIDRVLTRIAMTNTKTDDYRAEQINMQRQVDKHERWHFQVAEKTGVKLSSG